MFPFIPSNSGIPPRSGLLSYPFEAGFVKDFNNKSCMISCRILFENLLSRYESFRKGGKKWSGGNYVSKSKMISRRRGRGDAGVLFISRGADDDANKDSALILKRNNMSEEAMKKSMIEGYAQIACQGKG
ncbi:MAG: hypothetical protein M0Q01_16410 [Syntrophales bacterium]|nr:hypothetical protein [Syntrophales bacterium]